MREIQPLTALRGILACWVVALHASHFAGQDWGWVVNHGWLAVDGFFMMSGYLLGRSYRADDYGRYVWKRMLRLFPVHLFVLAMIATVAMPSVAEWALSPFPHATLNNPDWSLACEWAASLLLPAFMLFPKRAGGLAAVGVAAFAVWLPNAADPNTMLPLARCLLGFAVGVSLRGCEVPRLVVPAWLLFVGRISFPLYLVHWPLFAAFGVHWWTLPLLAAAAFGLHKAVEEPCRHLRLRHLGNRRAI